METDMAHVHGHHYNPDFVEPGSAEEVPPEVPEKTSVFKRMKAKAKKVKASIGHKMHGTHAGDDAGQVHDHDDEESDDEEEGATPVYDSERPRNFAVGQEGKPTGPLSSDADQNVCPGTFQTKVTDPDLGVNPPTATPPQFGADHDASSGHPKPKVALGEDYPSVPQHQPQDVIPPTDQSEIAAEAKQAPTDFDARYGEHWGSLEATDDVDSGALKSSSRDVDSGHFKSTSDDVIPIDAAAGDFNSGRLDAPVDDYSSEAFTAAPQDFSSGQLNSSSGGFKSGDFAPKPLNAGFQNISSEPLNAASDDYKSEAFTATPEDFTSSQLPASGGFKSGDLATKPQDYKSEAFTATPEDFTSGQLPASGGFKSGDLTTKPQDTDFAKFSSEPLNANSAADDYKSESFTATPEDFTSGQLDTPSGGFKSGDFNPRAASDDYKPESFTATPEDFTSGQLDAPSAGFKSGDFNPRVAPDTNTENFNSAPFNDNSGELSSESSKALSSDDFSSGSLRGASGGFSSFNSSHARATSGDLNSSFNASSQNESFSAPSSVYSEQQNTTSPARSTDIPSTGGVGSEDPISSSFAKMGIHDDQQRETETPSLKTGGHDEFCDQVESSPIPDFLSDKANVIPEHTESVAPVPETYSPRSPSHTKDMDVDISYPKDVNVDAHHPQGMDVDTVDTPAETTNQGGYLSSAVSAFTGAKNAVASKIGYSGNEEKSDVLPVASTDDAVTDRSPVETVETPQPQPGYAASATSAAVSAKNAVASKLGYGGSTDNTGVESAVESDPNRPPVDPKDDVVTDRSSVETPPQPGYVSSATSAAVSAKNAVASKLGYGGSTDTTAVESDTTGVESDTSGAPVDSKDDVITDRSPLETPQPRGGYVATATSALVGTAASVKDTVASKLGYGGTDNATTKTTRDLDDATAVTEPEAETDKGVSVKGYISEKLAPGEDDKALSDYISSALHKSPKEAETVEAEEEKPSVGEKVADAFHKRNDTEEDVDPSIPMGRVTESDQVASRLGSTESERTGLASPGAESPSTGMVGKFKGAISNWFGKAEETDTSPHSPIQGTTEEHLPKLGEEERKQ